MHIDIKQAQAADKIRLSSLMQFYIYDFTEFLPFDLNDEGQFNQSILDDYFDNADKIPFLVLVDQNLAGFVLVSSETILMENESGKSIKEFFIVRRYRKRGVGKAVARRVFSFYPGRWEVRVIRTNQPAEFFWEATIKEYTGGNYKKDKQDDEVWRGSVFSFASQPMIRA